MKKEHTAISDLQFSFTTSVREFNIFRLPGGKYNRQDGNILDGDARITVKDRLVEMVSQGPAIYAEKVLNVENQKSIQSAT